MANKKNASLTTKLHEERKATKAKTKAREARGATERRKNAGFDKMSSFGRAWWETKDMWNTLGDDEFDIAGNVKLTEEESIFGHERGSMEKELGQIKRDDRYVKSLKYDIATGSPARKKEAKKALATYERVQTKKASRNNKSVKSANKASRDADVKGKANFVKNVQKAADAKAEK